MNDKLQLTPAAVSALCNGDVDNFIRAATPGGIEKQEAAEQISLVTAIVPRLPKVFNGLRLLGIAKSLNDANDRELIASLYGKLGIKVISDYDDLFVNVILPTGWYVKAEEHAMWSKLVDEKDRERGAIFYKGAFYDRHAEFNFKCRFNTSFSPEDAYKSQATYDERQKMKWYGRAYDCEEIIFQTEGAYLKSALGYHEENRRLERELQAAADEWLRQQDYPEFKNPFLYWDK